MARQTTSSTTDATTTKNLGGRPLLFKTAEALEAAIEEYFDYCDNRIQQVYSAKAEGVIEVMNPAPYTMAGLAYALGMDRRSLLEYSKRDKFSPTIKRAKERVERDLEERLNDKASFTPGIIFNLKNNFGYLDQQQVDHTTKGKELPTPILGGATQEKQE